MAWYGPGECSTDCCGKPVPPTTPCIIHEDPFDTIGPDWTELSGTWSIVGESGNLFLRGIGINATLQLDKTASFNGQIIQINARQPFDPQGDNSFELIYPTPSLGLRVNFYEADREFEIQLLDNGAVDQTSPRVRYSVFDWNFFSVCYKYSATEVSKLEVYGQSTVEDPFGILYNVYLSKEFAAGTAPAQTARNVHLIADGRLDFDNFLWTYSKDNDGDAEDCPTCPVPQCYVDCLIMEDDFSINGIPDPDKWYQILPDDGNAFEVIDGKLQTAFPYSVIRPIDQCPTQSTSWKFCFEVTGESGKLLEIGGLAYLQVGNPGYIQVKGENRVYYNTSGWTRICIENFTAPCDGNDPASAPCYQNLHVSILDADNNIIAKACGLTGYQNSGGIYFGTFDANWFQMRNFTWEYLADWWGDSPYGLITDPCPSPSKCVSITEEIIAIPDPKVNQVLNGIAALEYTVEISGVANDVCTDCTTAFNNTFLLDPWVEGFNPPDNQICNTTWNYWENDALTCPGTPTPARPINIGLNVGAVIGFPTKRALRVVCSDGTGDFALFEKEYDGPLNMLSLSDEDLTLVSNTLQCDFSLATCRVTAVAVPGCGVGPPEESAYPEDSKSDQTSEAPTLDIGEVNASPGSNRHPHTSGEPELTVGTTFDATVANNQHNQTSGEPWMLEDFLIHGDEIPHTSGEPFLSFVAPSCDECTGETANGYSVDLQGVGESSCDCGSLTVADALKDPLDPCLYRGQRTVNFDPVEDCGNSSTVVTQVRLLPNGPGAILELTITFINDDTSETQVATYSKTYPGKIDCQNLSNEAIPYQSTTGADLCDFSTSSATVSSI